MKNLAATSLSFVLILSGCHDFDTINSASTKAVQATHSWNDVAGELEQSCVRDSQFNPAITDCQDGAKAATGVIAVDKLLTAYFQAIADVSDSKNFTDKAGLDDLAKSAGAIPGADPAKVKAAFGLVTALSSLITNEARERAMGKLINDGGPHARTLIDFLGNYVVPALKTKMATERDDLAAAFAGYVAAQGGRVPNPPEPMCVAPGPRSSQFSGTNGGGNFMLMIEYCRRVITLQGEEKALADYSASLGSARSLVDDLMGAKFKLKDKALAERIYKTGKDLSDKTEAVKKAFSKGASA